MSTATTTRNATLQDLAAMLTQQQARKVDLVAAASKVRAENGLIVVAGADPVLTADGVTEADGIYRPTAIFDEGVAAKLGIPVGYLKRLREVRPDLYDANVNGWLHGFGDIAPADARAFMLRTFRSDETGQGIARAFLSDRFGIIDHLDALTASLEGVHLAGIEAQVAKADLTDRRMVVKVHAPEVQVLAPELLKGYRSPFTGASGSDNPVMFAGFRISNSETGGGAFSITPEITVEVCTNGMTVTKDALRSVHLGGKLEEGVINWSAETQRQALDLIRAKTTDAVRTFLDVDYMRDVIAGWEKQAGVAVETVDAVRDVTKGLNFSAEHVEGILGMFVKGGQMTVGGVVNAITAYSQTVEDADDAYDMETRATSLLAV